MRRKDIDILKAIAIVAVILYHFGFSKYGYLGVDLFLVINGFFITSSLIRNAKNGTVSYVGFIVKRFSRLYPLVILSGVMAMILGAISMLPDNYENVAMSVVSTNVFSNNILAAITTKNYWDVVNNYKPLMHTWYLGILAEFYVVYPLLFVVPCKIFKKADKEILLKRIFIGVFICSALSLMLYLLPFASYSSKFYYLPFRFYELSVGGIIAFVYQKTKIGPLGKFVNIGSWVFLGILMFVNTCFINDSLRLLLVVVMSCLSCYTYCPSSSSKDLCNIMPFLVSFGAKSYSYFIWHQVILAFWRCYIGADMNFFSVLICLVLIVSVSELSYYFVENKIKAGKKTLAVCVVCASVLCVVSGVVYLRAGVIRDVPELGITTDNIQRQMHGSYCDRIYKYDKDFEDNGKFKVFVIGNSFARDWANILLESSYADKIDISYAFSYDESYKERLLQSEYVFLYSQDDSDYEELREIIGKERIWVVGTKNFGESNDMIYLRRFSDSYFDTTVMPSDESIKTDEHMKTLYKDRYIDLMTPLMNENNEIQVFTDDNKFISQDCRHLTIYGAKFYARIIDLDKIFQ